MTSNQINVVLSSDEALVLFEFVSRLSEERTLTIEDSAEQRVLWSVCCLLEKQLVEPFASNYSELLKKARCNLRDE